LTVLSEGQLWGWTSAQIVTPLLVSLALLPWWLRHELRGSLPLVDLRQLKLPAVLTADLSGFLISASLYLFIPSVVEIVQAPPHIGYGFGESVVVAAMTLIPLSLGTVIASRGLAFASRRFGTNALIPSGSMIIGAAMLFFALAHGGLWEAFAVMVVAGVGVGFTFGAMPTFIVRAVEPSETGSALGLYQVIRSAGLVLGAALGAALLAAFTPPHATYPSFNGFRASLLVAAFFCVLTAVVSFALTRRLNWATRGPKPAQEPVPISSP
jgi:MFS family permease